MENGYLGNISATETHPRNTAGTRQWQDTVKVFRDRLTQKGWTMLERSKDEYAEVVSPDGEWRLVVWGGDKYTGLLNNDRAPKSKNGKGEGTRAFIQKNKQYLLPLNEPNSSLGENLIKTIALIFYYDYKEQEVRAEISMPVGVEAKNAISSNNKPKVSSYGWRVVFSPLKTGVDLQVSDSKGSKTEFTDEIDIEIGAK